MRGARQTIFVCVAGIAFLLALRGPVAVSNAFLGRNDFVAFYTGGRLAFSPDLYRAGPFLKAEAALTGWTSPDLVFVRLPWQAALFAPLAALGFHAAAAVWFLLGLGSLVLLQRCWPSVPQAARAGAVAWSIPVAAALAFGQDVPLLLLALSVGFLLIEKQKPVWAGLSMSLCWAAKPHLFWALGLVFLFRGMWRVCAGGALGVGAALAVSYLTAGAGWVHKFMDALAHVAVIDDKVMQRMMPTLPAALTGVAGGAIIEIGAVAATIGIVAVVRNWRTAAAIAIILGIVTARHAFLQDCPFALVSLFLVWNEARQRLALLVATSPLAFIPVLMGHPGWSMAMLLGGAISCWLCSMARPDWLTPRIADPRVRRSPAAPAT